MRDEQLVFHIQGWKLLMLSRPNCLIGPLLAHEQKAHSYHYQKKISNLENTNSQELDLLRGDYCLFKFLFFLFKTKVLTNNPNKYDCSSTNKGGDSVINKANLDGRLPSIYS